MRNVDQIVRAPEHDQLHLILPGFRGGLSMEDITARLHECIEGVTTTSEEGIILGIFFTNTRMFQYGGKDRFKSTSLGVFPKYDISVEYEIKQGDFYVNSGRDPIIILEAGNFQAHNSSAILLFRNDPFRHLALYRDVEEVLRDTGEYGWARNPRKEYLRELAARRAQEVETADS